MQRIHAPFWHTFQGLRHVLKAQCIITLSYRDGSSGAEVRVPNRSLTLASKATTDAGGENEAAGFENATQLESNNLVTDNNGVCTTYVQWLHAVPPQNYHVFVYVYDDLITE